MFKNYFKTAVRSLRRSKSFTFINIAGLAVGIAVCFCIFLIIQFELSFDKFHSKNDRIYRVLTEVHSDDGIRRTAGVPFPLPKTLHLEFPSLPSSAVYNIGNDQIIIPDEKNGQPVKKFKEENGFFFTESSFFSIFDFPLLAGSYTSLNEPGHALVTKETAERYFGDWHNAMGKVFRRNNEQVFTVTGVLANVPVNTDFPLKVVASYSSVGREEMQDDWRSITSSHMCFILLPEGTDANQMNERLREFVKKHKPQEVVKNLQTVQSLSAVHYDDEPGNFLQRTISTKLINTLWLIALFILLIACVNFINLSTAQAINRSREVGVRKVLGGSKIQLRSQFFIETAIITFIALVLAGGITTLVLPWLKSLLGLPLAIKSLFNTYSLLFLFITGLFVIFLAGFYPAIVLSRFNPITALKSKIKAGRARGFSLRRGLVVFQFVIAQVLIIGTLIVVQQMDLFRNTPLGFEKDAIVNLSFPEDSLVRTKLDYLKEQLKNIDGVKSVSLSYASPADDGNWGSRITFDHAKAPFDWNVYLKWADADYVKTYDLQLAAGRNLTPSDTVREFLINEALLKRLGITDPEMAINKEISMWNGEVRGSIVGVLKDFNVRSLRNAMSPVLISTAKIFYTKANISIEPAKIPAVLKKTEQVWNKIYPDYVYEPQFLEAKIENFYAQESRLSSLYKIFAVLAIFLSCLGLYGLASFMAVQRIKEVGIRKVLGASVQSIIKLFSGEFLLLIGIAFVIAAPVAWYFMQDWLQGFVYRVSISWWIMLLAGVMAVVVALITISFQAIKAALANPVKSLRTE